MTDIWDCRHHFLLVEGVRRCLSLVAKTQYCTVLGGWCKITVFLLLLLPFNPLLYHGRSNGTRATRDGWQGANTLWSSCVMRPINSCWTCSDACNIGFSLIQQKLIRFYTIDPVSVAIWYRSDNRPFCNSQSLLCVWLTSRTVKTKTECKPQFLLKKRLQTENGNHHSTIILFKSYIVQMTVNFLNFHLWYVAICAVVMSSKFQLFWRKSLMSKSMIVNVAEHLEKADLFASLILLPLRSSLMSVTGCY